MKPLIAPLVLVALLLATNARALADNTGFLYAYALHDSHASDAFYSVEALKPLGPENPVRPYLEVRLQRDSRDASSVLPQTVNDNYGLIAGGMQYQGRAGLRIFAQVGAAFAFGPQTPAGWNLKRSDFRGGLQLYRNWNDLINNPRRATGSFFGSAVYYGRYENEFFFAEAERGREFGALEHPVQVYTRVSAAADTRGYFYNNSVSLTLGARVLPLGHLGPSLALEESYSRFIGPIERVSADGLTRDYLSFRPVLTFGTSF